MQKKTSAHDCCKSKKDQPKKHTAPEQTANCPQCLENRYKSPELDQALLSQPANVLFATGMPIAALVVEEHSPPLLSESARYLRLNTLLI